jgi:hypothetical protein
MFKISDKIKDKFANTVITSFSFTAAATLLVKIGCNPNLLSAVCISGLTLIIIIWWR